MVLLLWFVWGLCCWVGDVVCRWVWLWSWLFCCCLLVWWSLLICIGCMILCGSMCIGCSDIWVWLWCGCLCVVLLCLCWFWWWCCRICGWVLVVWCGVIVDVVCWLELCVGCLYICVGCCCRCCNMWLWCVCCWGWCVVCWFLWDGCCVGYVIEVCVC